MSLPLFAVLVVCCFVPLVARKHTHVFCDRISPMVVRECPAEYPVCCIWPDGVFTACCPERSMCDLYAGECVEMNNRTASGVGDGGDSYESGVVKGTPGRPDQSQAGVEVSLQFASSFVGLAFFGFLLLLSAAIQAGKLYAMRREEARRQRELEERELLVAHDHQDRAGALAGVEVGNHNEEAVVTESATHAPLCEDEELLCKVCFANLLDCALLKCGHISTCRWCAKKLSQCPICREHVTSIVVIPHVEAIRSAQGRATRGEEAAVVAAGSGDKLSTRDEPPDVASGTTTEVTERTPALAVDREPEVAEHHGSDDDDAPAGALGVVAVVVVAVEPDSHNLVDVAADQAGDKD